MAKALKNPAETVLDLRKKYEDQLPAAIEDALRRAKKAVQELNELGVPYKLVKLNSSRELRGTVSETRCPVCKFKTDPPHDSRSHRFQGENKKPFTKRELEERAMRKV